MARLRPGVGESVRVHGPAFHLPLRVVLLMWVGRRLGRAAVRAFRNPIPVLAVAAAGYVWLWHGSGWLLLAALLVVVLLAVLAAVSPAAFSRHVLDRLRATWRSRWVYRRWWQPAVVTSDLALRADGELLPRLRHVRSTGFVDVLTVRMLPGQTVDDWQSAGPRLAQTFGAISCRARPVPHRAHDVQLTCWSIDPLREIVGPFTPPAVVDLRSIPVAVREDGQPFTLAITGLSAAGGHFLVAGATGSGKGSVLWSVLNGLAPAIDAGLVRVWAIDPKGGMELAFGSPLFERWCYGGRTGDSVASWLEATALLLEAAVARIQRRAEAQRGVTRDHTPTVAEPQLVILCDELAAITAYVTDRPMRLRIESNLQLILSQGRAVGVVFGGATQDPRVETLRFRALFPVRVGLRATEDSHADMVLGEGARERGALTDRISPDLPGVGYVLEDGKALPERVRFTYLDDDAIHALTDRYGDPSRARVRPASTIDADTIVIPAATRVRSEHRAETREYDMPTVRAASPAAYEPWTPEPIDMEPEPVTRPRCPSCGRLHNPDPRAGAGAVCGRCAGATAR